MPPRPSYLDMQNPGIVQNPEYFEQLPSTNVVTTDHLKSEKQPLRNRTMSSESEGANSEHDYYNEYDHLNRNRHPGMYIGARTESAVWYWTSSCRCSFCDLLFLSSILEIAVVGPAIFLSLTSQESVWCRSVWWSGAGHCCRQLAVQNTVVTKMVTVYTSSPCWAGPAKRLVIIRCLMEGSKNCRAMFTRRKLCDDHEDNCSVASESRDNVHHGLPLGLSGRVFFSGCIFYCFLWLPIKNV